MAGILNGSGLPAGTAAPTWRRFTLALAFSAVLHGIAVFGMRAGLGNSAQPAGNGTFLVARLVPRSDAPSETGETLAHAAATMNAVSPDGRSLASSLAREPESGTGAKAGPKESASAPRRTGTGALPLDYLKAGYYYPAGSVHKPPAALGDINFEYPTDSAVRDGVVFARVLINARGEVDDAIVESAEPAGIFDSVAVKSLKDAKFSPGLMHGVPVPTELLVEIRYKDPGGSFIPGANITLKNR